jgi:hypothetical protein
MPLEISDGIKTIRIVWRDCYPPDGGHAEFLAAYDGDTAAETAKAVVELLKKAGVPDNIQASPVKLWPLLKVPLKVPE